MSPRNRMLVALITIAAVLVGTTNVQAHGGGHGGGGHGGGFHGGGFHGGGYYGGGFYHGGFGGYGRYGYGGYGYLPFGYGLGLGLGVGYGLGYGGFGYGYPYGYGAYGYPYAYGGYGYRYGPYGSPYGYGYGYPSAGYGAYGYGVPYGANVGPALQYRYVASNSPAPATTITAARPMVRTDFARQAEDAFQKGDFATASRAWQHAEIDDPRDGTLALKAAQAMFAAGQYHEAADAVERGMAMLPQARWGSVVRDRAQLYGAKPGDYATQLQALERAAKSHPDNPDEQFLLAYHYAFSMRSADATPLLDNVLRTAPDNHTARALRASIAPKFAPPAAQPPTARPTLSRKPATTAPGKSIDL